MGLFKKVSKGIKKQVGKVVGGERARKKLTQGLIGAGTGFLTGGPIGAVAGGLSGSLGKVRQQNLRGLGQSALGSAAAGLAAGGLAGQGLGGRLFTRVPGLSGLQKFAKPALGTLFGGLGSGRGGASGVPEEGFTTEPLFGAGRGPNLATLAGGSLLAAGLTDKEAPQTFEQPGALSPEEQAQLDALAQAQQEAIGRGQQRLFGDISTQRATLSKELAELQRPQLLEEARQIREALGAKGIGSGGLESSGAFGEATARAQERLANQRQQQILQAFLPLTQQATGLGLEQELAPVGVRGAGVERLFGLRDIGAERGFAAEQARRQREAERNRAMIEAGGNILAGNFGSGGGLFGDGGSRGGGGGLDLGGILGGIGRGIGGVARGIGGLFKRKTPTFAPRVSNLGREPLFT